jgi:phenylalanyl-tRNA synthetase beta chain
LNDISIHEDLVEEIARIYGYNTITPVSGQHIMRPISLEKSVNLRRKCEELLTMRYNAQQVETYPRVSPTHAAWIDHQIYSKLLNSLAPENSSLRSSMIPGLLNVVKKNEGFFERGCIYDIGQIRTAQGEQTQCGIIMRQMP